MYKPARQFFTARVREVGIVEVEERSITAARSFSIPAVVNSTPLPYHFLRMGKKERGAMSYTVWKFHPFEYEMIIGKVDMNQGWCVRRGHGTRRKRPYGAQSTPLEPLHLDCSPRIFHLDPYQ